MNAHGARLWRLLLATLLVLVGATALTQTPAHAVQTQPAVYVIEIHGAIDLGLASYLSRVLR